MSDHMDHKTRAIFSSKFNDFEGVAEDHLWEGVAKGIGQADGKDSRRKWVIWISCLVLLTSLSIIGFYPRTEQESDKSIGKSPQEEKVNDSRVEVRSNETAVAKETTTDTEEKSPNDGSLAASLVHSAGSKENKALEQNQAKESLSTAEETRIEQGALESESAMTTNSVVRTTPEVDSESDSNQVQRSVDNLTVELTKGPLPFGVKSSIEDGEKPNMPIYDPSSEMIEIVDSQPSEVIPFERKAAPNKINLNLIETEDMFFPEYLDDGGKVLSFETTRLLMRLNFGVMMNYLVVRPNDNDNILFEEDSPPLDLSPSHLGLRIGYDVWYHVGARFWLKNQIYLNGRQHKLDLNYDPDVRDGEEVEFQRLSVNEQVLSLGLATGFLYQIDNDDAKKRSVDFLISYEQNLVNGLKDHGAFSYPDGFWSVNLGFTFSPKRGRDFMWLIRPFGYYSLNRGFGDKAAELAPFGFGVQFIRHR